MVVPRIVSAHTVAPFHARVACDACASLGVDEPIVARAQRSDPALRRRGLTAAVIPSAASLDLGATGAAYIRLPAALGDLKIEKCAPVAQLDRAQAYEAWGYMFESCRAHIDSSRRKAREPLGGCREPDEPFRRSRGAYVSCPPLGIDAFGRDGVASR